MKKWAKDNIKHIAKEEKHKKMYNFTIKMESPKYNLARLNKERKANVTDKRAPSYTTD